jgi:hypothetical protein
MERIVRSGEYCLIKTVYPGQQECPPKEITVDGKTLYNVGVVEIHRNEYYRTVNYIFREMTQAQIAAEESVRKAESALQAAKDVLGKVKGV